MHGFAGSTPGTTAVLSRRKLIGSAAGGAGALSWPCAFGNAQEPQLSGTIRVGYESAYEVAVPYIKATAAGLEAGNPDASIELKPSSGGNYIIQLVLQLTTGQAPDVILLAGPVLAELAAAGHIAPLDHYVAGWEGWKQYSDSFKLPLKYEGSVWSIPHSYDTHFLYYRRDIFERAGLPFEWEPESLDDVLEAASAIKSAVSEVIPYALYAGANGGVDTVGKGFLPLVYAYGGQFRDENDFWIIDSCAIRDALRYYERAYQFDQTVPQDVMTGASPVEAMRQAMLNGELGMLCEGSWVYGEWLQQDAKTTRDQIGYTLFPSAAGASPVAVSGPGYSWYINSKSEQQELAWAFIEAFNSMETQVAINVADPHIPGRLDAANAPAFQEDPFLQAVIESASSLVLEAPDPSFRQLITVVQNGTGVVATGEATPDQAMDRYSSELARILGEENVVRQSCP
ncbi:sugar ABC transporter substrate-binding protein [soil metagenome]